MFNVGFCSPRFVSKQTLRFSGGEPDTGALDRLIDRRYRSGVNQVSPFEEVLLRIFKEKLKAVGNADKVAQHVREACNSITIEGLDIIGAIHKAIHLVDGKVVEPHQRISIFDHPANQGYLEQLTPEEVEGDKGYLEYDNRYGKILRY